MRSGFAIGTILLAVVLLAAIVSALVVASRGSNLQAEAERNRLDSSFLAQAATNLSMGLDRARAAGQNLRELRFGYNIGVTNDVTSDDPETRRLARECGNIQGMLQPCTNEDNCAWGSAGVAAEPPAMPALFCNPQMSGMVASFQYRTDIRLAGQSSPGLGFIAVGIRPSLCQQINNILHGDSPTAPPPREDNLDVMLSDLLGFATNVADNYPIILPDYLSLGRNEGCFFLGQYFNSAVYYRLLSP